MTRRTLSSVVVVSLLVGLLVAAAFLPVPYVTMSPGPTVDVFAEADGRPVIDVEGAETYPTEGALRLTTVSVTSPGVEISLVEALSAWFDGTRAVYPREVIYPPDQTAEDVERESSVQMVSSQDTAVAVALAELGYDLEMRTEVLGVTKDAPADGELLPRDRLLEINGVQITDVAQVAEAVQRTGVGETAEFVVRREGESRTIRIETVAAEDDPERAVVGIEIGNGYDFPFDVRVRIDEQIGGPSAGLIFSLAIYDTLTPGALTGGDAIAGTGTIDPEGAVGAIGGIQQKVVAAADAGAEVFLVPAGNCDAARAADVREDEIRLVRIETMHQAVKALETYTDDQSADLPGCG
ncbi:MAG: PDZ domain-containing protein [Nocardioidaceae bacterium]|nr:PDZ domain-containing protein [Nocardioidaceae bacterium]